MGDEKIIFGTRIKAHREYVAEKALAREYPFDKKQKQKRKPRTKADKKKTENALNLLTKALYNIRAKKYIKNRLSCGRCDFFNTAYCT